MPSEDSLELYSSPNIPILDSDYIFNQLVNRVNGESTGMDRLLEDRVFAGLHVFTEFYQSDKLGYKNKFEKMAAQSAKADTNHSAAEYRRVFENDYLPKITFVNVGELFKDHGSTIDVARKDIKDAPTAQLALLLRACHPTVYSHNKALISTNLAPQQLDLVEAAQQTLALANTMYAGTVKGASFVYGVVDELSSAVASELGLPQWVIVAGLGSLIALLLKPPERRQKFAQALGLVAKNLLSNQAEGYKAKVFLDTSALPIDAKPTIEQAVEYESIRSVDMCQTMAKWTLFRRSLRG